jgi:eukaryotic-like serine/threonine-protein kinase
LFGDRYGPTYVTLNTLGSALRETGRLDEAEATYLDAMRVARETFGEEHRSVADVKLVLSIVHYRKGEMEEAETLIRQAVAFYEREVGPEHYQTAGVLMGLAGTLLDRGELGEAEAVLRRCLRIYDRSFPSGLLDLGDVLNRLAFVLAAREAPDAEAMYRRAVDFDDSRAPESPVFITDGYQYLASLRHRHGDLAGAERNYRTALGLGRRQLARGHVARAESATGLGAVLLDAGRPAEAARYLLEGVAEWEAHVPRDPTRLAEARALLERARAAASRP